MTFLALLEMIRLKLVRVFQAGSFGPIRVYKRPRPADAPHPDRRSGGTIVMTTSWSERDERETGERCHQCRAEGDSSRR